MRKPIFTFAIVCATAFSFVACSNNDDAEGSDDNTTQELNDSETETEDVKEEEPSPFGNFEEIIGVWHVDAATAGMDVTLTFKEDGSFLQDMGPVQGQGTWEVVDDEHIKIVTQNTKEEGQTWLIENLTGDSFELTWNPESAKPNTLPMQRVN
ncbi:MAG: hypothetical protein ACFHU9_08305 [Fluviicola sp.]